MVDSSRVYLRDSTELIEKYKADVTENGVLLLMRLDTLPSSLAMALHYYCDEYNPLANKSAIFSTLDLVNCNGKSKNIRIYIKMFTSIFKWFFFVCQCNVLYLNKQLYYCYIPKRLLLLQLMGYKQY